MKKGVMISVDSEVHAELKAKNANISEICERAMFKELKRDINAEEDERVCHYCGQSDNSMVWDGWLELWKCSKCHNGEIRRVSIMAGK
jgi:Zn finger protein HypA/HybF involved in hydrogenase expression